MIEAAVIGVLGAAGVAFGVALALLRQRAYRRRVWYDPRQTLVLGTVGPSIETHTARCSEEGIILPGPLIGAVSAFLEVDLRASVAGRLFDPAVEITAGDFCDVQYFERGARGTRFLNVSRLLNSKSIGDRVRLNGRRIAWKDEKARLHFCRETVTADDRVLVVAPHPDDAEIAAFGFYADTCATIVTLTAGDASDRYCNSAQPWLSLPRSAVASTRVWDSLTVPQLGDVPAERAINLCAPDGRLGEMYRNPDCDVQGRDADGFDFPALRRLNRSPLVQDSSRCTWRSLVLDLANIIAATKPTIVVAPHPTLDPHPDHLFSTVALVQALRSVGTTTVRMFLYTVHNRRSELWPFGPAGSGVALLPILPEDGCSASGFYSHGLSAERQRQKFIALEAMHDVRDMQWPADLPPQRAVRRLFAQMRALIHGMGEAPTSYLRRAVRPDEVFFVTSFDECAALAREALAQGETPRAAA